jgi:hypothetical protein
VSVAKGKETWYVARKDMTLAGQQVHKGQLVRPSGAVNDHVIYGDATAWVYLWQGKNSDSEECGTDGCRARFDNLGSLQRHRALAHGPEWDARMKARASADRLAREAEEQGLSIGGHEIVGHRSGPGGQVPYIKMGG